MPSTYDYSDDESIDVRVKSYRRAASPRRPSASEPHYIQTVTRERDIIRERERPSYYQAGPVMLAPERTVVSHTRSRSRERRSSPPSQVAPVVIQNKIINEHSSDDDSDASRHRRHHRSHSRYSDESEHEHDHWELQRTRRELETLKLTDDRKREQELLETKYRDEAELSRARRRLEEVERQRKDEELDRKYRDEAQLREAKRRLDDLDRKRKDEQLDKQYRDDAELREAKRKLDDIQRREQRAAEEERLKKEIELKKLEEERKAELEKKRREKEKADAVAEWKLKEAERIEKEKKDKEAADKEYQRRLQEDLIRAGVDEKDIAAILKKEKVKAEQQPARPTYTRMSLKHLDIETLIYYKIEFEYDQEPGYVIIKRWVPENEQDILWEHTRMIRVQRKKVEEKVVLKIEDKHHHRHLSTGEDNYEWVRKKERRRSKSPAPLLMYLAGAKH